MSGRGRSRRRRWDIANRTGTKSRAYKPKRRAPTQRRWTAPLKSQHQHFVDNPSSQNPSRRVLTLIHPGIEENQRLGPAIRPVALYGNIVARGDPEGTTATSYGIRVGFAQWLRAETADTFRINDLMYNDKCPGGPFNPHRRGDFKILWSRFFMVYNDPQNAQVQKSLRYNINLAACPSVISGADGAQRNQIFWFALSDDVEGTAPPTIEADVMFRFRDA